MSEGLTYPFTAEQISNQAAVNANFFYGATLACSKEHSLSAEEMWTFIGQKAAPGWEEMLGAPVSEVAKWFALNWVAVGAEVRSLSGDEAQGQVVMASWPSAENLELWGLTREDADATWTVVAAITEYLGLEYDWTREGDEVTHNFSRTGAVKPGLT